MKIQIAITFCALLCALAQAADPANIYAFSALDIDGNNVTFDKYDGKVLLVVNVASHCTLTDVNYRQMNELYTKYKDQGLRIAAFPSNEFAQEPGTNAEIKKFVQNKNVKFDVYGKIDVNGDSTHPIYQWLKTQKPGILGTTSIKWNFTKFLLNKKGVPVERYSPTTTPESIEETIQKLLKE